MGLRFGNSNIDFLDTFKQVRNSDRFSLLLITQSQAIFSLIHFYDNFARMVSFIFSGLIVLGLMNISSVSAQTKKQVPLSCPTGEHWVKAHSQNSYVRSDGTFVSGSYHRAHCQKNLPSYAIWNERLKNGFPPKWEFRNEKSKVWTD